MIGLGEKQARSLYACQQPGATFNLWEGSIRAGKTYVSVLAFLLAVSEAGYDGELVIVGKNLGSIYRNFFRTITNSPGLAAFSGHVHYRQNAPTATIFGREVQVIGLNDGRAESKIRGMTILLVYVDEASIILEETFKQILNRMSLSTSKLYATTNPDSPAHWLKVDFLDKMRQLPDWRRYHFVMEDNPSTSEEVRLRLRSQYTGLWYKRFIEGLWVSADGAIFDMFDEADHVIPFGDLPKMKRLLSVGVDFGTNNPSAGIVLGQSAERTMHGYRSRLYLVDEWGYDSRDATSAKLSPSQQAQLFQPFLTRPHLPYDSALQIENVIVDPASLHFHKELNLLGIPTHGGLNKVGWGLSLMASLFAERHLIVSDRCQRLIREIPGYAWDKKHALIGEDVPVKVNDHWIDAARYAVATTEPLWRPSLSWESMALAA